MKRATLGFRAHSGWTALAAVSMEQRKARGPRAAATDARNVHVRVSSTLWHIGDHPPTEPDTPDLLDTYACGRATSLAMLAASDGSRAFLTRRDRSRLMSFVLRKHSRVFNDNWALINGNPHGGFGHGDHVSFPRRFPSSSFGHVPIASAENGERFLRLRRWCGDS